MVHSRLEAGQGRGHPQCPYRQGLSRDGILLASSWRHSGLLDVSGNIGDKDNQINLCRLSKPAVSTLAGVLLGSLPVSRAGAGNRGSVPTTFSKPENSGSHPTSQG